MNSSSPFSRTLAAAAGALLAVSALPAGAAKPSSFAESRGYQLCVEAAGRQADLVQVASDYYIYERDDARRYYLNGHAFRDGESSPIRIACDTTVSGTRLLDVRVDAGQYAGRLVKNVEVARN